MNATFNFNNITRKQYAWLQEQIGKLKDNLELWDDAIAEHKAEP